MKPVHNLSLHRLQNVKEEAYLYSTKSVIFPNGQAAPETILYKIMSVKDIYSIHCYSVAGNSIWEYMHSVFLTTHWPYTYIEVDLLDLLTIDMITQIWIIYVTYKNIPDKHLTNVAINMNAPTYVKRIGGKWFLDNLKNFMLSK